MTIAMIAALDRNGVIGCRNALPWRLPRDLARFRELTLGKPVVMGRLTFESIGRPLPGRTNIVVSRQAGFRPAGVLVVRSPEAALDAAKTEGEVMVAGGASLYAQLLPRAGRLYLTQIDAEFEGDRHFPPLDPDAWREVARLGFAADAENPHPFAFVTLEPREP